MLPLASLSLMLGGAPPVQAAGCEQAGRRAESASGIPSGLLLAVGRVESGRWNARRGRLMAWPWAIDVAGQGRFFPDKAAAVRATRALLDAGKRNIDVGCYQVSLLHHPSAFADLAQAFDPMANARYAAALLASLHRRYGDWAAAVAAYHSADPLLGLPYRDLVFAAWRPDNAGADLAAVAAAPSVHVWTPGTVPAGPQVITLRPTTAARLPRVITLQSPPLSGR